MAKYNSTQDTLEHRKVVRDAIQTVISELIYRSVRHDQSKLVSPEKEAYDEYTPLLQGLTYGSPEYMQCLESMRDAINHHYAENRHHPEHFENGIDGMNLVDLIELFCDWKAATMRHRNGNLTQSLKVNKKRFNMSDQLVHIFENTIEDFGW